MTPSTRPTRAIIILFILFTGLFSLSPRTHADLQDELAWASDKAEPTQSLAWGDVDGDGDLDLAVGNDGTPNQLYLNQDGTLPLTADWVSDEADNTQSVAWGDVDGDGDLDLAVGNDGQPNRIYFNRNGALTPDGRWNATTPQPTQDLAWGDVNGDGWLDLMVGNRNAPNELYLNENGTLPDDPTWATADSDKTQSVAWADIDGDGDLDLAVGNDDEPNVVYRNDSGTLAEPPLWQALTSDSTQSVAWGDMNGDGLFDLAVGNDEDEANVVYLNSGHTLADTPAWTSTPTENSQSLAWGDTDGDGDVDLAVGNDGASNAIYLNENGTLILAPDWASPESNDTHSITLSDIDGNGNLELTSGNKNQPNQAYVNQAPPLSPTANVVFGDGDRTAAIAWGDVDSDGDLDLAIGDEFFSNRIYLNEGGMLTQTPYWVSADSNPTRSIAWGDMDGDGDLDLAVGNESTPNSVYLNSEGTLVQTPTWVSAESDNTQSIAWGDVDGDGDLDLAVGNYRQVNRVYLNNGGILNTNAEWTTTDSNDTSSVAWGDVDGDGDLDLAVGNQNQPNMLYRNENSMLKATPDWISDDNDDTQDIAWGDMNNDGNLDLAVGNLGWKDKVYLNEGNNLSVSASWESDSYEQSLNVKWGDVDGDSDLDLVIGQRYSNLLYLNENGILTTTPYWVSAESDNTQSVAWGDVDRDGDLDFVAGNVSSSQKNQIYWNYRNDDIGSVERPPTVATIGLNALASADNYSVATIQTGQVISISVLLSDAEVNAVGQLVAYYSVNGGGVWQPAASANISDTLNLATGVISHSNTITPIPDGGVVSTTLNLNSEYEAEQLQLTLNISHTENSELSASLFAPWPAPNGTRIRLFEGVGGSGDGFSQLMLDDRATRPITETIGVDEVVAGRYRPVDSLSVLRGMPLDTPVTLVLTDTVSGNSGTLEQWTLKSIGVGHTFYWDTFASGFFGESDNVVVRFEARPYAPIGTPGSYRYYNTAPGPFQHVALSATTFPFRVRGTRVQVYSETVGEGNEAEGARILRLPAGQTIGGQFMRDENGRPHATNADGYLPVFDDIQLGDQIAAVHPITVTESYTIYHTSYVPEEVGLSLHEVITPGVQVLTVSADNPLVVFDLDVSLEWDARGDEEFLADLHTAFRRASETLFDVSNGQVALGNIRLHHNRENWVASDVVIHASGSNRPRASMGGIATDLIDDVDLNGQPIEAAYGSGQVHMGTVWDPFGENTGELGEHWWLALAHELAHYLLYLPDNYLGLDSNGAFMTIDCPDSFMTSTYNTSYSELLTWPEWLARPVCNTDTFAAHTTGRHDWGTVTTFYPTVLEPAERQEGPVILPFDLAAISTITPTTGLTATLAFPPQNIDLRDSASSTLLSVPTAQGYVFQQNGVGTEDDTLLPLGNANGDRLKVRGAKPGDMLCVFAPYNNVLEGAYSGCGTYTAPTSDISLDLVPDWRPNLKVTAVNSTTLQVTATLTSPVNELAVQLFPTYSSYQDPLSPITSPMAALAPISPTNPLTHTGLITSAYPLFEGHIYLYDVNEANHQAILPFYLNPPWGPVNRPIDMGPNMRAWGANRRAMNAPVTSGDGAVTVYNRDNVFGETGTFSLQALATMPNLPSWMNPVGQGYRFVATRPITTPISRTIAFDYLQRDAPAGYEYTLFIIYSPDEGQTWERLPTSLDTSDNLASAAMPSENDGQGIYAVVSSLALPQLEPGWNSMVYPFPVTRPVQAVFAAIEPVLNRVCDASGQACYEAGVLPEHDAFAPLLNELSTVEPFSALQVVVTTTITPYIGVEGGIAPLGSITPPPATYFGWVTPTTGFAPVVGMTVTALIDAMPCGQGVLTDTLGVGQLAYVVDVPAGDGCDSAGQIVSFQVGQWSVDHDRVWSNEVAHYQPLDTPTVVTPPLFTEGDLLLSTSGSGTIGGIRVRSEDIVAYNIALDLWSLVIDGSDIDLRGTNINAFMRLSDNSFLISVSEAVELPGVGLIEAWDVVRFVPTQLGLVTDGSYELFFEGGLHGLTENIDALHLSADGQTLYLSTAVNVAGLGRDEDIHAFDLTTNEWRRYFDGFDVGLTSPTEDVNGIWLDPTSGVWYLTTIDSFAVANLLGSGSDIFACLPLQLGEETSCSFLSRVWLGDPAGVGSLAIDAFSINP